MMPTRRLLQKYAIAISIISVFYNAAEGIVSIALGAESSSRALVFYGLQSAVEVISDVLVAWRFLSVKGDQPGNIDEQPERIIRIERIATIIIGTSLVCLTFAAIGTSAASLKAHDHPTTTLPALLIGATSTCVSLLLYLAKRYLARALDSSALYGEALCALCCTELSVVLLVGSLIYMVWKGGWWLDAATAMVIGVLFGWEGVKSIRWARSENFNGGCCGGCPKDKVVSTCTTEESEKSKEAEAEESPCCCCSKKVEPGDGGEQRA